MSPSIGEGSIGFGYPNLLLVAFRCRFLDLAFAGVKFFPPIFLSLDRALCIKWPWLAVCAEVVHVFKILIRGDDTMLVDIVTFSMLPGVTRIAVHGVSVVVLKAADAFDGVIFEFITRHGGGILKRCSVDRIRPRRSGCPNRRRGVRVERGGICHTMANNVPLLYECCEDGGAENIRGLNRMTCERQTIQYTGFLLYEIVWSFSSRLPQRTAAEYGERPASNEGERLVKRSQADMYH